MNTTHMSVNDINYVGQHDSVDDVQAQARVRRLKLAVEEELCEFERRKREVDRVGELSWDQRRQFSKRLDALGQRACSVLKKRDAGRERLRALARIISASQERGRYLARRGDQQLEDFREGCVSVHRAHVRQLEDQQLDERKKMRS